MTTDHSPLPVARRRGAPAEDGVIVAGAGIGGLAIAIGLHRAGVPVTVLEQSDELRAIGAAIGIQTNAVRALRGLGQADELLRRGMPIEYYEYYSWRGQRLVQWSQGQIGRDLGEPTVVVHRAELQELLLRAVRDEHLQLGVQCTGYQEDAEGVTVRLSDGRELRGAVLVGADGLHSSIRRQLLDDEPPRYSGWVAYRGITRFVDDRFPPGFARQTLGVGRSFGMWHLSGGRVYWVATITEPAGGDVATGTRKRHVLDAFAAVHQPIVDLVSRTDEDAILRNEVYDRKPVACWSSDRVVLLGDAAHPTTPVTGQGGGQAIIDAAVLAEELKRTVGLGDVAALRAAFEHYERRREPVTSSITNEAWRIAAMHHFGNRAACRLRDLSMRLTPTRTWNKRMKQRLAF